jgi:hypothetical protein
LDFSNSLTAAQVLEEMKSLPSAERARVVQETLRNLKPEQRRNIERFLRRLQHPEVPETFWQGVEDHEDGKTVDMETALREAPPGTG